MLPTTPLNNLQQIIAKTSTNANTYKPLILRVKENSDKLKFQEILQNNSQLRVFDTIIAQLGELIKCQQPTIALMPKEALTLAVANKLGNTPTEEYGVWVYYPWDNKLVHLLDEEEFAIVRTNRNKHKITAKEQAILATKKIGVMGLSVGQSVSLTLAMERGFGELRIADFDELDLSNINRIRTGAHNIGLKKTVIVAREIAEIDPFLNVVCFHEGITENNIKNFLTNNGTLDLLIDECDSFDIKINARQLAKSLNIPVLMEGSDRGTIDIERFDLDPERPILHGLVAHLDFEKFKHLKTFDEKVPYITAVTGLETLSPRMKASAVELMATISTWPQLASAVTFGGGVSADLSRKILLNNLTISGRFFLDLDELISDKKEETKPALNKKLPALTITEITIFLNSNEVKPNSNDNDINLSQSQLEVLIKAAKQAPSGGNNQPWHWHYQNNTLHLFLNKSDALAYLDPQFISSYTSIGAAIENLLLAAAEQNLSVNWQITPEFAPLHLAYFNFSNAAQNNIENEGLFEQIPNRHTNRKSPQRTELEVSDIDYLQSLVTQTPGAKLNFVTNPTDIKKLAQTAVKTDLLRMFIPEAHQDFITREMRWTEEETLATEDGIGIHTLDLNNNDQVGLRLLQDEKMLAFLKEIDGGSAFNRLIMHQFMSASAIGLITVKANGIKTWIKGGIAAQRMWLGATKANLQIHPINVPLIFFYKNTVENSLAIDSEKRIELINAEKELNLIFDKANEDVAVFMFRIFRATNSPQRTIRKSNDKIFSIGRV